VAPGPDRGLPARGEIPDAPDGRRLGQVGLTAREVAQERALADLAGVAGGGRVCVGAVAREPEGPPQELEDLLVLQDQLLAQLDEVGPADRQLPLGIRL